MAETGASSEGEAPTPDVSGSQEQPEPSLSQWERQKLEVYREEHPEGDTPEPGEMPSPDINETA
jgi:hypothetical protein